jgi:Ferritin-like domain
VFEQALQNFTLAQWGDAGLNATDLALIAWMAEQEVNHKQAFANMIGENAPQPCTYRWPFADPKGFIEYALLNTRYGESGTIGWIPLLDNRASGNIVIQAITTESRQQYTFRQWRGLFPMPVAFEPAIIQPYHWTLLSRDIVSCPPTNKPVGWPIFPSLNITNQPLYPNLPPRITQNDTGVSAPNRTIYLSWGDKGIPQGPYNQTTSSNASDPKFALVISQLNATAVPLDNINMQNRTAQISQPGGVVFGNAQPEFGLFDAVVNG